MQDDIKENNNDNNNVDVNKSNDDYSKSDNTTTTKIQDENKGKYNQDDYCQNEGYNKCELETFQRVRYYTGQLLVPDDLIQLTRYFNSKRHLINQQILGVNGVVCGLNVKNINYHQGCLTVNISSGFAIDCCGKEIVVAKEKKHSIEFPEKFFNEKIKRIGLFITRYEIKKSPIRSISSECECDDEYSSTETRIEEGYKLFLKPIENSLLGFEFDRKNYCIGDIVKIEVWDPDNTLEADKNKDIEIKVNSTADQKGISLKLINLDLKENPNFYRGEFSLSEKESIKNIQLKVMKTDTITAKLNEQISENVFVNSTDSFIYNQRNIVNKYFEDKLGKCTDCNNSLLNSVFNNDRHGILISILKTDRQNQGKEGKVNVFIDIGESSLCKKVIYNNQMLYDLFTNKSDCKKAITTDLNETIVISQITNLDISDIGQGEYKIIDPIEIFKEHKSYQNIDLDFPPIVYLGRASPENKNDNVSFNEDIYLDTNNRIVIDGLPFSAKYKGQEPENIKGLEANILFKPIDITKKSFKILIAKVSGKTNGSKNSDSVTGKAKSKESTPDNDKQNKITLRWWAVCKFKTP